MKASVFIAQSADGYIARHDGNLDWLDQASVGNTEDFGYGEFYSLVSCIVMGRKSYEKVLTFGDWPYIDKRVVVLSTTIHTAADNLKGKVEFYGGNVKDLYNKLRDEGESFLYIDGGSTIQSFIRAGLIDDLTITTIPILIGTGISLFGDVNKDVHLELVSSAGYKNGFVQTIYNIKK